MKTVGVWTPTGGVLGAVAPLGMGVAARAALVVDLDPAGPLYPGSGSLAALVDEGPRAADLRPTRRGIAVLRNGGVGVGRALEVLRALIEGWPVVVLRLGDAADAAAVDVPAVEVHPLLDVDVFAPPSGPAVYQRFSRRRTLPGEGLLLPRPAAGTWPTLLDGRLPAVDRWIRAWRRVWSMSWV